MTDEHAKKYHIGAEEEYPSYELHRARDDDPYAVLIPRALVEEYQLAQGQMRCLKNQLDAYYRQQEQLAELKELRERAKEAKEAEEEISRELREKEAGR